MDNMITVEKADAADWDELLLAWQCPFAPRSQRPPQPKQQSVGSWRRDRGRHNDDPRLCKSMRSLTRRCGRI